MLQSLHILKLCHIKWWTNDIPFSMASFVATTYPTRKPANPYALENVLNKMHYQSVLVVLMYQIIFSSDEFEICFIN